MKILFKFKIGAALLLMGIAPLAGEGTSPKNRSSYYDGASSIQTPHRPSYLPNIPMTCEAWVRRDRDSGFETVLSQDFNDSFWFGFAQKKLRFYRSGRTWADSSGEVPRNQWTHIAVSYDGARARFYINGVPAGNSLLANTGAASTSDLFLGSNQGSSYFFKGSLDEVRLWSTSRSEGQISGGMFTELRGASGPSAVWDRASSYETVGDVFGSNIGASRLRIDREGILPQNLVVPLAAVIPTFDGNVNAATEYAGAEKMVLRYDNGPNFRDAIAHLVHRGDHLYVGVEGARLPSSGPPSLDNVLRIFLDTNGNTTSFNSDLWRGGVFLNDGALNVSHVETTSTGGPFPITFTDWRNKTASFSTVQILQGTQRADEFTTSPDLEFRIHRSLLGDLNPGSIDRIALSHTDNGGPGSDRWAPTGGNPNQPATWTELCYSPWTGDFLPTVDSVVRVVDDATGDPIPGITVQLNGFGVNYETRTTSAEGWAIFRGAVGVNDPLQVLISLPDGARPESVGAGAEGVQPTLLSRTEARFPGCSSNCRLAQLTFRVMVPVPQTGLVDFSPQQVWPPVLLRSGGSPKSSPAATVIVTGNNLHDSLEFFFAKPHCPNNLSTCTEGVDYFPATSVYRLPAGEDPASYQITVPGILPSDYGSMRLTAHDTWSRPANNPTQASSWRNFASLITVGPPPYPLIHGFAFKNEGDGHDIDDYRSAFYDQVCDPRYMVGFWAFFPIYLEMLGGGGECVGMTATAQQFAKGRLTAPLGAGVRYGNGFLTGDVGTAAPKPARFNTSNPCSPVPTNVWGAIRANHGVQMSSEFIGRTLEQFHFSPLSIKLADQLDKIRARPTNWMICLRNGDKGHCVQPLRVIDTVRDDAGIVIPGLRQIEIWDCNHPNQTRVIDINLNTKRYTYNGAFRDNPTWIGNWMMVYEVDPIYNGERHVPSIDTLAFSLGQYGVTHLWELFQLIVSGDAEPMITAGDGSQVGWTNKGTFLETGSETYPIPNFNWLTTDEDHRPVSMHHRMAEGAPIIDLHNQGASYKVHSSHHGTIFQLFVEGGQEDTSDLLNCTAAGDRILGLHFQTGGAAISKQVSPRIALCRNASEYPLALTIDEVIVPSGEGIGFASDPDGTRITFDNDTSSGMTPGFTLTTVNRSGDLPIIDQVPALPLPAGARFTIASPDGLDFRNLTFSTDLDRDGISEISLQFLADTRVFIPNHDGDGPALSVTRMNDGTLILKHPQNLADTIIQFNEDLEGAWRDLDRSDYSTTVSNKEVRLDLGVWKIPTGYFRLKFVPLKN